MNTYYCGLLISILPCWAGVRIIPRQQSGQYCPLTALVATVYHVSSTSGNTPCYRTPDADAPIVTLLREKQLVDLVSLEAGMVQTGQDYWLHVYPRIGHRPTCYINVRNLVPVS